MPSLKLKLYLTILSSSHSLSYPEYICIKNRIVFLQMLLQNFSAANINRVLPAIALFLLCLALYRESQQPLSESTDKPGGEQSKVIKSFYIFSFWIGPHEPSLPSLLKQTGWGGRSPGRTAGVCQPSPSSCAPGRLWTKGSVTWENSPEIDR